MNSRQFDRHTASDLAMMFRDMVEYYAVGSVVEEAFGKASRAMVNNTARNAFELAKELAVATGRAKDIEKAMGTEEGMWLALEMGMDMTSVTSFFKKSLTEASTLIQRMKAELKTHSTIKRDEDDEEEYTLAEAVSAVLPEYDAIPKMNSYKGRLYTHLILQHHLAGKKGVYKPLSTPNKSVTGKMLANIFHDMPQEALGRLFVEVADDVTTDPKEWAKRLGNGIADAFVSLLLDVTKEPPPRSKE